MAAGTATGTKQFLVFRLDDEEFGVDIRKITTIIEKNLFITRVPNTPDFIKGVINLRGEIIPVIDSRIRFGMPSVPYTEDARIIIIKLEDIAAGIIVDRVAEVIELNEENIGNAVNITGSLSEDYISGIGKLDNRIVTILNLEKLIGLNN